MVGVVDDHWFVLFVFVFWCQEHEFGLVVWFVCCYCDGGWCEVGLCCVVLHCVVFDIGWLCWVGCVLRWVLVDVERVVVVVRVGDV